MISNGKGSFEFSIECVRYTATVDRHKVTRVMVTGNSASAGAWVGHTAQVNSPAWNEAVNLLALMGDA